ncbi:hypothetical protein CLOP_g21525 [Closterium sp. NIES-67]|nr:hypothetical protein CLOP_g21525 [Closterium sp. NIES-67]
MESRTTIDSLSNELLKRILWHSLPASREACLDRLRDSLDPDLKAVNKWRSAVRYSNEFVTPIATPPPSAGAALCLLYASVCRRWRALAKDRVTTLLVEENLAVCKEDLAAACSCFRNLTHLHLSDGSVGTLGDGFLSHLASKCSQLTALHVGWRFRGRDNGVAMQEHLITPNGLDELFQKCTGLQQLSIFRTLKDGDLRASFFQLTQLHTLLLTDAAALENPDSRNLACLTTLYIGFPWRPQHLAALAHLPRLARLLFCTESQNSQPLSSPSVVLPPSLQWLDFLKPSPQLDSILPPGPPCTRLQELLLFSCKRLHRLPSRLGELLPCLRKLTLSSCDSLSELPGDFHSLTRLESLIISARNISTLPPRFGRLPALRVLSLETHSLTALPDSFCLLSSLRLLDLICCINISQLPADFSRLAALEALDMSLAHHLVLPESFGELSGLQYLRLSDYHQESLPHSFTRLSSLTDLEFCECMFRDLPDGVQALQSLREVRFFNCPYLEVLPGSLAGFTRLESLLYRADSGEVDMPFELSLVPQQWDSLEKLKELELSGCRLFAQLSEMHLPSSLEVLSLGDGHYATALPDLSLLPNLTHLTLELPEQERRGAVSGLTRLEYLCLLMDSDVVEVPFPLGFPLLKKLTIFGNGLRRLPEDIGATLPQLQHLKVQSSSLEELPESIAEMQNLVSLRVDASQSKNLAAVPAGISSLPRLRMLRVAGSGRVLHEQF